VWSFAEAVMNAMQVISVSTVFLKSLIAVRKYRSELFGVLLFVLGIATYLLLKQVVLATKLGSGSKGEPPYQKGDSSTGSNKLELAQEFVQLS